MTSGAHISVSTFKQLEDTNVLSIDFFNYLLQLRNDCEKIKDMEYKDWYEWNFKRTTGIIKSVG